MEAKALAITAAQILDAKKADQVRLIDISQISTLGDYFVLATGTSGTHVKALADELEYQLKEKGVPAGRVEGYRSNSWILLDYESVIIHIFTPEARAFYDLDRLWQDGIPVDPAEYLTNSQRQLILSQ